MFTVTKHYPHSLGLSAVFRQPGAQSHCKYLHGYALAFTLVFEADVLDDNNWVIDFGSLKPIKEHLVHMFDHTLLVARSDPKRIVLEELQDNGLAEVRVIDAIGCEAFAFYIAQWVQEFLMEHPRAPWVRLRSVTCSEHAGNSATYECIPFNARRS